MSGHRGSPRRAPGASLPALNPSRKTRPHSHSRGVAGCPRRRGRPRRQARPQGKAFPSRLPHLECVRLVFLSVVCYRLASYNDGTMANLDGWLSLEETAAYLGMGKTALYALARDGGFRPENRQEVGFRKSGLGRVGAREPALSRLSSSISISKSKGTNICAIRSATAIFAPMNSSARQEQGDSPDSSRMRQDRPRGAASPRPCRRPRDRHRAESHHQEWPVSRRWTSPTARNASGGRRAVLSQEQMIAGPLACTLDSGNIFGRHKIAHRHHEHPAARDQRRQMADAVSRRFLRHDHHRRGAPQRRRKLAEGHRAFSEGQSDPHDGDAVPERPAGDRWRAGVPVSVP